MKLFNTITKKIILIFLIITINLFMSIGSYFIYQPLINNSNNLTLYINDMENSFDILFQSVYQISSLVKKYPTVNIANSNNELNNVKDDLEYVSEFVEQIDKNYSEQIGKEIEKISNTINNLDFQKIDKLKSKKSSLASITRVVSQNTHLQMKKEIEKVNIYMNEINGDLNYVLNINNIYLDNYYESLENIIQHKKNIDKVFNNMEVLIYNEVSRVNSSYEKMISFVIITTCISFLFLIVILTNSVLIPFKKIKKNLTEMSKGNLNVEFKRKRNDDIKEIYDCFNDFLRNINNIFDLEDMVLQENDLDTTMLYIYDNFVEFIPFHRISITYENKYGQMNIIKVTNGLVYHKTIKDGHLKYYKEMTVKDKLLIVPLETNNVYLGNMYFHFTNKEDINVTVKNFIGMIESKLSMAFYKNIFLKNIFAIITDTLAEVTEHKDKETGNHIFRISEYAKLIALDLMDRDIFPHEIDNTFIENIKVTSSMHDIGKVSIPDNILNKPSKLDNSEFEIMKSHSQVGGEILSHLDSQLKKYNINYFEMATDIALHHHEKFNGQGYPNGLKEDEIPLSARIIAVADVLDALLSKRSYKEAFNFEKSYSIIVNDSGSHFDPEIIQSFINVKDKIYEVYLNYS